MIEEIFMNKKNFDSLINDCQDFANRHESIDYLKEINKAVKQFVDYPQKAWDTIINSKVFYLAKGKYLNRHGNYVTYEV